VNRSKIARYSAKVKNILSAGELAKEAEEAKEVHQGTVSAVRIPCLGKPASGDTLLGQAGVRYRVAHCAVLSTRCMLTGQKTVQKPWRSFC